MKLRTTLLVILSLSMPFSIFANESLQRPFALEEFFVNTNPQGEVVIHFRAAAQANGTYRIHLQLPEQADLLNGEAVEGESSVSNNQNIVRTWRAQFSGNGRYLIEVGLSFEPAEAQDAGEQYLPYLSFPLYIEVNDDAVGIQQATPPPQWVAQPEIVDRPDLGPPEPAQYIAPDTSGNSGISAEALPPADNQYLISVYVSGQVTFNNNVSVEKGIPDIAVWLDWDYDNDVSTGYTPYDGGNSRHVDYDKTTMNGSFYFSFAFEAPHPASYYSSKIRVYASHANTATFNWDLGNGAQFSNINSFDISGATTSIYNSNAGNAGSNGNPIYGAYGSALRYLYRARLFSINDLNFTPARVVYYIDDTEDVSFFCEPGNCGGRDMAIPRIMFNGNVSSGTGYHEYGHFIEYAKVGFIADVEPEPHHFTAVTNHILAWNEGWAEFYSAATHMYWYREEMPAQINSYYPQFLDYAQQFLPSTQERWKVEGAVACFFYSL